MSAHSKRLFLAILATALATQAVCFARLTELYYKFPIKPFSNVEASSNENHPDYAWAECKDSKLYAKSIRTYGTAGDEIILDLVNGELSGSGFFSGPDTRDSFVIRAPDQGGDYFKYMDKLAIMGTIFKFTRSRKAENYINRVVHHLKKLSVADTVRVFIHSNNLVLGTNNNITVEYKVKEDRDIVVSFGDKNRCYAEKRTSIKAGAEKKEVDLSLPLTVSDMKSTYISVKVVPTGADSNQKIAEAIVKRESEAGDRIFNLYVTNVDDQGHAAPALYAGKNNEIYTNWRVAGNRDIIIKLVDQEGREWAENKFSARPGGEDYRRILLFIPENTPKGTGYRVIERIVPSGGSWENSLAEEVFDKWGRGLSVK